MGATKQQLSVGVIVASQTAPPLMFSGVAVVLPQMSAELDAGATELGLVATLFFAGSVALLLPVGRLADATDKPTIYKVGMFGFAATSLAIGLSSWMPLILALRLLQGALSAGLTAAGPALLADLVPPERRGRVFGASLGSIYAGLTLGPICAGWLVELASWRALFVFAAAVLLVMGLALTLTLDARWHSSTRGRQLPSAGLVMLAVGCLVAGSATLDRPALGVGMLVAGLSLAVAFVLLQLRLDDPLLDVRALVGHRVLRSALLVQLLLYTSAYCSVFVLSLVLQVSYGHSAEVTGYLIALSSLTMAVTAPIAGRLTERVRPRVLISIGVAAVLASGLLATRIEPGTELSFIALIIGLHGLGFGLFSSPNMTVVMNSAQTETLGVVSALAAKSRALGMITGLLISAVLISLELGNERVEDHPVELLAIALAAFWILAGISALALLVSLFSPTSSD